MISAADPKVADPKQDGNKVADPKVHKVRQGDPSKELKQSLKDSYRKIMKNKKNTSNRFVRFFKQFVW